MPSLVASMGGPVRRSASSVIATALAVAVASVGLAGCTASGSKVPLYTGGPSATAGAGTTAGTTTAGTPAAQAGGTASGPGAPVTRDLASVFRAAASTSADKGSARVNISMDLGGQGVVTATGVERWKGGLAADFSVTMSLPGQTIAMRELLSPSTIYIKMSGALAAQLPTPWLKMSLNEVGKLTGINVDQILSQARQSDPSKQLSVLAAAGDITKIGPETVNGVPATHYRGRVDLKKLLRATSVDKAFVAQLSKSGVSTIAYDLWLNADKLPVKLVEHMTVLGRATTLTLTMSDYGVPVTITPPAASQVTDISTLLPKA
jgi:hypothetical protein